MCALNYYVATGGHYNGRFGIDNSFHRRWIDIVKKYLDVVFNWWSDALFTYCKLNLYPILQWKIWILNINVMLPANCEDQMITSSTTTSKPRAVIQYKDVILPV